MIDTGEAKNALRTKDFGSLHINEFCQLLAEALPDKTDPLLFLFEFCILTSSIDKCQTKSIDIRGKQFHCGIGGCQLSAVFNLALPKIVKQTFSTEFAEAVLAERASVYAEAEAAELGCKFK